MSSQIHHPCQNCGACCASFRVHFYWLEAEKGYSYETPTELTEDLDLRSRCMKGTSTKHQPRCIALKGRVGDFVRCDIYLNRPTPCRQFSASYENGKHQVRCDEARAKHGLKPLTRESWLFFENSQLNSFDQDLIK